MGETPLSYGLGLPSRPSLSAVSAKFNGIAERIFTSLLLAARLFIAPWSCQREFGNIENY